MAEKLLMNYIEGKWVESESEKYLPVENPATREIIGRVPISTREEVDAAVKAARRAFKEWRRTPPMKRVEPLYTLRDLMKKNQKRIAEQVTLEHGKIFNDAYLEVQRAIENIEVAVGIPTLMQGNVLEDVSRGIDESYIRQPVGVFSVIPAFNFPAMIPFWFLPYAVATGNTFIVKPSEITPMTQSLIFELIEEAGFPDGVINLVNGDRTVAESLITHPGVDGISSVTSTPVARHIYRLAAEHGKRVQCQAGAKNFALVMDDIELEKVIPNLIRSVYGNTGQRCLAISNVIALESIYDELVDMLVEAAKKIKVGFGLDEGVDMGPVISEKAKNKITGYIETGIREGANLVLDGRDVKVEGYDGYFLGPTIFSDVKPDMTIAREEIFGPVLSILKARDFEDAVDTINSSSYGNAAVIYTSNGGYAREFTYRVNCGNIGVNIGVAAPIACFPFCGMKDSFFGDIHGQSMDAINFFTHKKVVITRWM